MSRQTAGFYATPSERTAINPPSLVDRAARRTPSSQPARMHLALDVATQVLLNGFAAQWPSLPLRNPKAFAQRARRRGVVHRLIRMVTKRGQVALDRLGSRCQLGIHARRLDHSMDTSCKGEGGDPLAPLPGTGERSASRHAHTFRAGYGRDK